MPSPLELSSLRGDWMTPASVIAVVEEFNGGRIGFDPCPGHPTHSVVNPISQAPGDGLAVEWGPGLVYCNPPYNPLKPWANKARAESLRGAEIVFICPPRTGTLAFQDDLWTADRICFWAKRISFINGDTGLPVAGNTTDSMLAYWGPRGDRFTDVFGRHGRILTSHKER